MYKVQRTPFKKAVSALSKRWWWRYKRDLTSTLVALVQPALWLVLFGNLFAKGTVVTESDYITFMTGGVVIMTVFNGALNGGVELLFDRETGMLRRLLAAPISPGAILVSRLLFLVGITSLQGFLILGVAILLGVNVSAGIGGVALILCTGALLGIGVGALSMALAFGLNKHNQFFAIVGFVSLPFIFASSALAPLDSMPDWLRSVAMLNPLTYAIESVRELIINGYNWQTLIIMSLVLVGFDIAMVILCLWTMNRALD